MINLTTCKLPFRRNPTSKLVATVNPTSLTRHFGNLAEIVAIRSSLCLTNKHSFGWTSIFEPEMDLKNISAKSVTS